MIGFSLLAVAYSTAFAPPPGAYDPSATAAQVCRYGYTRAQRALDTYPVRDRIYDRYGLARGHRAGLYVIDHLIPLELGGLTTDANLWPQPIAEAARKDDDENRLHAMVCAGMMRLEDAQREMLRLWGPAR